MNQKLYIIIWKKLEEKGIIFKDTDSALRENEELFKEYFASVVPVITNSIKLEYGQVVHSSMYLRMLN